MPKIKLQDIESRIVKHTAKPYTGTSKVNLNDLIKSGRLSRRKKKIIHKSFPVQCITYDTKEEIDFIMSLLRMRVITKNRKDIAIDLGEEPMFLRLSYVNQLKLITSLLEKEIDLLIDGCVEKANDKSIQFLKTKVHQLEKNEVDNRTQKQLTLEKLMWLRYGNKVKDPVQKQKELDEFNKQIQEVRKAKGMK